MLQKMKDEIELLSRHVIVIRAVMEHQPIGIMKLSELLDLPFHRIRYSLRVLEQLGLHQGHPCRCNGNPPDGRSPAPPG